MRPILVIPLFIAGVGLSFSALQGLKRPSASIPQVIAAPAKPITAPQPAAISLPIQPEQPISASGRRYPSVPSDPKEAATLLMAVETALRDPITADQSLPDLGHQQQVIYRVLSADKARSQQVLTHLEPRWRSVAERHLAARREFLRMSRGRGPSMLPAWRIIQPEPADQLLAHYRKAEAATGIEWEVLAAVNLVETGMGRIDGISVANAHGPMQFLPTTWNEPGIGKGNIRDPHDAIQAAARYLVRRGGLKDIRQGLWGYNNSDYYGRAVLLYASLMKEDPMAFRGLYHWEIHFNADVGDLWLPVGYHETRRISVQDYLRRHPASVAPS
ncbi:MAG: lytic transglycosylase [Cyanobium sp. NAT70]|nr:lytic transglycosylase [Cyanobium sp. NAT70]|tara:strand:- start:10210 stop:11199 length:990 start_codon:yes stop_codon:yes gene_type:complete